MRLGIGYDLSPDVNFYMEIIDSATWGGNGIATNAGNGGDPLNHNCAAIRRLGNAGLGVRAAYMLVRNLAGVQGLSMKVGRQYVVFGNHSLFGHFDWANTGYSHDGVMFAYQTKSLGQLFRLVPQFGNRSSRRQRRSEAAGRISPVPAGGTRTATPICLSSTTSSRWFRGW